MKKKLKKLITIAVSHKKTLNYFKQNRLKATSAILVLSVLITNIVFDGGWRFQSVFADAGHSHGEEINGSSSDYPLVTVVKAQSVDTVNVSIDSSGVILSSNESDVFPLREGIVQDLYVNVGDYVDAGQIIGTLYPGAEQTVLSAELTLVQAQSEAAEQRRAFIDELSIPERELLEDSLENAAYLLDLKDQTRSDTLSQLDTQISVAESAMSSAQENYASQIEALEVSVQNAEQQLSQEAASSKSAISEMMNSVENFMYTSSGVLSGSRSSKENYRRKGVYAMNSEDFRKLESELISYYKTFDNYQKNSIETQLTDTEELQSLVDQAIDIATSAQRLANNSLNLEETLEDFNERKESLGDSIDHLIEVSADFMDSIAEITTANAEKALLESNLKQELVSLEGDIELLLQELSLSETEQESVLTEQEALIKTIETQLGLFDIDLQSRFLDGDLEIAWSEAQVSSILQKMGAGRSIVAPFSGTITKRYVNVGSSVSFDQPAFHLVNEGEKFVRFYVNESDFPFIEKEQEVNFVSSVTNLIQSSAKVVRIASSLDPNTRTILVEAEILKDDMYEKILPNMSVRIQIPVSTDPTLRVVPESALELSEDGSSLWFVNALVEAESIPVEVHFIHDGYAYLKTEGLEEGILDDKWFIIKSPVDIEEGLEVDTVL